MHKRQIPMRIKKVLLLFISFYITLPSYIFLHEGGHSLVAILCGARITKFSILHAHMNYEGGTFNTFTSSLLHSAGFLLPLFISFLYLLFYRKNIDIIFYRIFSFCFCIMPLGSAFAWVIIPILYIIGSAPPYEDVTKFINVSGIHPLWVMVCAILLILAMINLAWHKKIIHNFIHTVNEKSVPV